MTLSDFIFLKENLNTSDCLGSDTALGNIFILQERYKIKTHIKEKYLLREFGYSESIKGFAFPLALKNQNENLLESFLLEITDGYVKKEVQLCLFSEYQKKEFDIFLQEQSFPYKIEWKNNPADNDYIYLQNDLKILPGKKLQKKRNHISQFQRRFETIHFEYFDKISFSKAIYDDFIFVAESWIKEQLVELADYKSEIESLKLALKNIGVFDFTGGVLYVDGKPVAVTLASKISDKVLDIHFEKCLGEAASYGGYAVINNLFIKYCEPFHYVNREEDLGLEGLRKAKLSYKPEIILEKFYGILIKN